MTIAVENENQLVEVASRIISHFGVGIYAFNGEMGIGKTTLIRHMLQYLNVADFEGSPTFAIIQSYESSTPIYHLDCYRIENQIEAFEIGLNDFFYDKAYYFIEWPEKIKNFLPSEVIWVYIRKEDLTEKRIIQIKYDNQS